MQAASSNTDMDANNEQAWRKRFDSPACPVALSNPPVHVEMSGPVRRGEITKMMTDT